MEAMHPIRKHLSALTSLPSAARGVLIEVCELVENGGQGKCFAGNQHLAEASCCHPVSVSRHLTLMKELGLVEIEFDGNDNSSRTIIPTPELVAAYTSGEVEGLNRVLRLSKHPVKTPLSSVLRGSKQGANHTTITTELTSITTLTDQLQAANAALLALQAENEKLKSRLGKAEVAYIGLREENKVLKAKEEKPQTKGRRTPRPSFVAPTEVELLTYMLTQRPFNNKAEIERMATKCHAYYTANGWKVGKNPMKDWEGAARTFLADVPKAPQPVEKPVTPQHELSCDALYGYNQTAQQGLAAARQTPEYQAYLQSQKTPIGKTNAIVK
jgi:predicted transcriptional regulator